MLQELYLDAPMKDAWHPERFITDVGIGQLSNCTKLQFLSLAHLEEATLRTLSSKSLVGLELIELPSTTIYDFPQIRFFINGKSNLVKTLRYKSIPAEEQ